MYNFNKNKILYFLIYIIIIINIISLSITHFHKYCGSSSLLTSDTRHQLKTFVVVDRMVKGIFFTNVHKKLPLTPVSPEKRKNKLLRLLFYILSTALLSHEKSLILLVMIFVGVAIFRFNKFLSSNSKGIVVPPEFKFYVWWSLKFLSPIKKCIVNRADIYDINPVLAVRREMVALKRDPHIVISEQSAGFFYVVGESIR